MCIIRNICGKRSSKNTQNHKLKLIRVVPSMLFYVVNLKKINICCFSSQKLLNFELSDNLHISDQQNEGTKAPKLTTSSKIEVYGIENMSKKYCAKYGGTNLIIFWVMLDASWKIHNLQKTWLKVNKKRFKYFLTNQWLQKATFPPKFYGRSC